MFSEKPVAFGRANALVGVLCTPTAPAAEAERAVPTAVFLNAGILHRVGPNRLYVRLARMLARAGITSLRFDLAGVGDSPTPRGERGSVLDIVERDIADAIDLASRSSTTGQVVLVGLCSGADNAVQAAVRDPRVVGAVLLDPNVHRTRGFWLRHYARRLVHPTTWRLLLTARHPTAGRIARGFGRARSAAGREEPAPFLAPTTLPDRDVMEQQLQSVLARGCRLFYVFTGGLPYRYNHGRQFERTFPRLERGDTFRVAWRPRWDHSFTDPAAQLELGRAIVEWFEEGRGRFGQRRSA